MSERSADDERQGAISVPTVVKKFSKNTLHDYIAIQKARRRHNHTAKEIVPRKNSTSVKRAKTIQ